MISDEEKQELYTDGFADGVKQGIEQGVKQGIKQGVEQGLKQGIEQGIEKNRIQTAQAMLNDGMPAETVSKYTGLSVTELPKL